MADVHSSIQSNMADGLVTIWMAVRLWLRNHRRCVYIWGSEYLLFLLKYVFPILIVFYSQSTIPDCVYKLNKLIVWATQSGFDWGEKARGNGPRSTMSKSLCSSMGDEDSKIQNPPFHGKVQVLLQNSGLFPYLIQCSMHGSLSQNVRVSLWIYLRWGKLKMAASSVHYVIPCIRMGKHVHSKTLTKVQLFNLNHFFGNSSHGAHRTLTVAHLGTPLMYVLIIIIILNMSLFPPKSIHHKILRRTPVSWEFCVI